MRKQLLYLFRRDFTMIRKSDRISFDFVIWRDNSDIRMIQDGCQGSMFFLFINDFDSQTIEKRMRIRVTNVNILVVFKRFQETSRGVRLEFKDIMAGNRFSC
jgi:hypothetical protein